MEGGREEGGRKKEKRKRKQKREEERKGELSTMANYLHLSLLWEDHFKSHEGEKKMKI